MIRAILTLLMAIFVLLPLGILLEIWDLARDRDATRRATRRWRWWRRK